MGLIYLLFTLRALLCLYSCFVIWLPCLVKIIVLRTCDLKTMNTSCSLFWREKFRKLRLLQIEEYFQQLPPGKVPRLGSPGEKYRDKQLMLQLPKQDLALAYCKHVETQHHPSYEDFINARNEIALDIGYVKDNNNNNSVSSTVYTRRHCCILGCNTL